MASKPRTILIATVGGSCAPLLTSIRTHRPDYVYFICSQSPSVVDETGTMRPGSSQVVDGIGMVCGAGNASIVAQTGLDPDRYEKLEIDCIDDVQECFAIVDMAFRRALARRRKATIIADYTGGTKTMTAALVRAATGVYAGVCALWVVTGARDDLRVVRDGTETAVIQGSAPLVLDDRWHESLRLVNGFHYGAALVMLNDITRQTSISLSLRERAVRLHALCAGLDAWDRFEFVLARRLLAGCQGIDPALGDTLVHGVTPLADIQEQRGEAASFPPAATLPTGLAIVLPVYDLINNARRRKSQGRYDDAVIRLNRAVELVAQNVLWYRHHIDIDDVDITLVPVTAQSKLAAWRGGYRTTGLVANYALLREMGDPVARVFFDQYEDGRPVRLGAVVEGRNTSYLAHGHRAIDGARYDQVDAHVAAYLAAITPLVIPCYVSPRQLPSTLDAAQLLYVG